MLVERGPPPVLPCSPSAPAPPLPLPAQWGRLLRRCSECRVAAWAAAVEVVAAAVEA